VAYAQLKEGAAATQAELIDHVKARLARFKAPRLVIFDELPCTATGRIQKFRLREQAAAAALFAEDAQ
jgi:fatty-acyl-CoA synthase